MVQAVRFDASADNYSVASTGLTTPFTLACWFYVSSYSIAHATVIGWLSGWCMLQRDGSNNRFGWPTGSENMFNVTLNTWHFFAVTRTTGTAVFYNAAAGAGSLTVVSGSEGPSAGGNFMIGQDPGFTSERFDGRIAQVKLWTVVLTEAELTVEYPLDDVAKTAGLWAYYSFRDGPQTTDESGSGHTLTVAGSLTAEDGPPVGEAEEPVPTMFLRPTRSSTVFS